MGQLKCLTSVVVAVLFGWEGNRRSGVCVALALHHTLCG